LIDAVSEIEMGLIDAHLGGNVVKKRVGTGGQGKSGGVRTILAIKLKHRAYFLYGFAKNQRANLDDKELQALKKMAAHLLSYGTGEIETVLKGKELVEVNHEKK
jgi:hypothetical protein